MLPRKLPQQYLPHLSICKLDMDCCKGLSAVQLTIVQRLMKPRAAWTHWKRSSKHSKRSWMI